MVKNNPFLFTLIFLPFVLNTPFATAQSTPNVKQDSLLLAAEELMAYTKYCILATVDEAGVPQLRMMDPFPAEKDMTVWLGTNRNSHKVSEIRKNPRVSLFYQVPNGVGYVSIEGRAYLVDEEAAKSEYWKQEWEQFYARDKSNYLLIKVVPSRLEVVSYKHGLLGDTDSWEAPYMKFADK